MDTETTTQVATVAVWVAWLTGGTLCLAVLGAACEAVIPGVMTWVGMAGLTGLYGALRLLLLLTLLTLVWRLLVTYLHLGASRHTYVTRGRHRPAYIRTHPWTPSAGARS